MPKRRSHDARAQLDPDAVLAGRVKVTAAQLLDLIHRVNPTGRELSPREAELRYALKSRLQSLLIRRFGPELEVSLDPEREGTVSILHRGSSRDGCHAVLDALDEDARAWVQLQIDLGPPSSASPPAPRPAEPARESVAPPSDATTPDSLVRRADASIDAFDYERARVQLARAVAVSGGAPGPAQAFLTLLVDTLGDDAEALSLQASLSPAALAHHDVRALLALAEARSGDEARAFTLVRGAREERSAGVFAALCAKTLGAGDPERAATHLGELRQRAPTHPSIVGLTDELARARAAARGPLEAEILMLEAEGRDAEAEKKAAGVLARWPDSTVARRVLRAVEERRRRADAVRFVAEAEAALRSGDADGALAALARAASVAPGAEREVIARRAREIEVELRARREAERIEHVQRKLRAGEPREGMLAYLELDEVRRTSLHADQPGERLRWLDLSRGAPRARVEAVLAFEHARERVAVDPEAGRALLAPHLAALERVPEVRLLVREAEARIHERRITRARDALREASSALAAGRAEEALAAIDEMVRDLPDAERATAEALRMEASRIVAGERRATEIARLRRDERLFEARDLASTLATEAEGEARARWEAERREIQASIQRAFRVEVDEEPRPFDGGADPFPRLWFRAMNVWLTDDGRAFVLAEGQGPHLVVNVVEHEGLVVRAAVRLRMPEPFPCHLVEVVGRTLWMVSERGAVLSLSLDTWEVRSFRPHLDHLPRGSLSSLPMLPTGAGRGDEGPTSPRFLWAIAGDGGGEEVCVFDLADRRPPRVLSGVRFCTDLLGAPEPRAVSLLGDSIIFYEDRGALAPEGRLVALGGKVRHVAMRPDGEGVAALVEVARSAPDRNALAWVDVPFHGPPRPLQVMEGVNPEGALLGRAGDAGLVVASVFNYDDGLELVALGAAEEGSPPLLAQIWRRRCPTQRMVLMTDARARWLRGYELRPEGALLLELDRAPPAPPAWTFEGAKMISAMDFTSCIRSGDAVQQMKRRSSATIEPSSAGQLLRVLTDRPRPDPMTIIMAIFQFEGLGRRAAPEITKAMAWLSEHHPDHPDLRVLQAEPLAKAGRWQEVIEHLAPLVDGSSPGSQVCPYHEHHLTALALLHLDDVDRARETLGHVGHLPTGCPFDALRDLCTPLPDPLTPEAWGPDRPLLVRLIGAALHADACLTRGDAEGALASLAKDPFSTCGEVQILARLAEAWLAMPAPDRRARFHKITALARFVEVHAEKHRARRRALLLPRTTWDEARLDDVSTRASTWLAAEG